MNDLMREDVVTMQIIIETYQWLKQILQSAFYNGHGSAMECEQVNTMHVRHRMGWGDDAATAVK